NEEKYATGLSLPAGAVGASAYAACAADRGASLGAVSNWSQASQTAWTEIRRSAQLSAPGRFRLAETSRARCSTTCGSPYGPQAAASDAPNSPTQGVSKAAARCKGPVSALTTSRARASTAASSNSEVGGARIAAGADSLTIVSAHARSRCPPQTTTLRKPRSARCRATAA